MTVSESGDEGGEVDGTETSEWIPTLSGVEAIGAASLRARVSSAAVVFTRSDVVEGGARRANGVDGWVDESEGGLSSGGEGVVGEGDHTSEDWSRGRGTRDLDGLATDVDDVVVTEHGNIRVTTSLSVVLARWGQLDTAAEVALDGAGLVRGLGESGGEASSGGDETAGGRGAGDFGGTGLGTLGGTNGSDVRGGGGERGVESALRWVASGDEVGNTVVSGGDHDGDTSLSDAGGKLVELGHGAGVFFGFDATVGHGVDEGSAGVGSDGGDPFEVDIGGVGVGDGPEDGWGTLSDGDEVLNVEVGFTAVVGVGLASAGVVGADDLLDGLVGEVVGLLELGEIGGGVALSQGLEEGLVHQVGVLDGVGGESVVAGDELRGGVAVSIDLVDDGVGSEGSWASVGGWERGDAADEVDVLDDGLWEGVALGADDLSVESLGGEDVVLGVEHLLGDGDGGGDTDELSVGGGLHLLDTAGAEPVLNSGDGFVISVEVGDLVEGEPLSVLGG